MIITFLIENKTDSAGIVAEHGLSVHIETQGKKMLFDTGASDLFLENAKKMNVALEDVDAVVISHGHYDHTGGAPEFCKRNRNAPIYIHQDAFQEAFGMENGQIEKEPCSILWDDETRAQVEPRLFYTQGPVWLTDDIVVSGTLPDVPGEVPSEHFYIPKGDGTYEIDPMRHEQILVVRDGAGIYIFSGCSHKGVFSVIACAQELFPGEKIQGLIAGMHLYNADAAVRKKVVGKIVGEKIERVMPVHCTGLNAICELKTLLGEHCILAAAGERYEYQ